MANQRSSVPAITRAMRIIDLLANAGQEGLSATDLASATDIPKSTTALICQVLEEEGLARRVDGRYRLGRRFLSLAAAYLSTVDRVSEYYAQARSLPITSRESSRVAALEGTDVIYLARYQGSLPGRQTGQIGDHFPAHVTATGKALLSTYPENVVRDRFRNESFVKFTEKSIQSLPELIADVAQCRQRGYAMDDEETNLGQVCFAIPVIQHPNRPAQFAVSITLSKELASQTPVENILYELNQLAEVFVNPLAGESY